MTAVPALTARRLRLAAAVVVLVVAAAVVHARQTSSAPAAKPRVASAEVGTVTVTVGGVGRIVPSGTLATVAPASASSGSATGAGGGGGATPATTDALFPRAGGTVARVLVKPGQTVVAGQPLAVVDDAGVASSARQQAEQDVAAAGIALARARSPLTPADVSALSFEVRRARADLEALRGGTSRDRARAQRVARQNVTQAARRLHLVQHPRTAADIAAAAAELSRAEADLAALVDPPPPPAPSALAAGQAAVTAARARLAALTGPPDPAAVSAARAEIAKAEADLAAVRAQNPPATPGELASATAARDAAQARLDSLLGPPAPAEVAAADADVRKAEADLVALQTPTPAPSAAAVAAARAAVGSARAKLANLRRPPPAADVAVARLELTRARADLQTLRSGPSATALAAAQAQVASARTRLADPTNPRDIEVASVGLDTAGTRLAAARLTESLLTVRAVADGTVTNLLTRRGSPVDPTTPVATVSNLARLAVDIDISEFDAAQVQAGMPAVLRVDALGTSAFRGTVQYASPTGTDNGGVVTFPVRVTLSQADGLKAGMNVSVRIVVDQRRDVVQVPLEAIQRRGNGKAEVTVLSHGRTVRRTVSIGLASNKSVEVVDGLRAGEKVVLPKGGGGGA